jgi:hypothetical protein
MQAERPPGILSWPLERRQVMSKTSLQTNQNTPQHNRHHHRLMLTGAMFALALSACQSNRSAPGSTPLPPVTASPQVILDWSETAYQALVAHDKYANPLWASRLLAMMHLAQHDAVAAVTPRYAPYALDVMHPGVDPAIAAAAAAHTVLAAALPDQRGLLDAALTRSLASSAGALEPAARSRALRLGADAAAAIQERRRDDGADTPAAGGYQPRTTPGAYRFVAPFELVIAPGWRHVRPFALQRPEQYRSPPPPALDSPAYAAAFDEVKAVGGKHSSARTPDQGAYAKFWWEFSDIGWNRVARVVTAQRQLPLAEAARLFALLNMALADSYIAGWDAKQHHDFWRPTTAIREAASDGNPATQPDPSWESVEITPPAQDYPSTHSALGRAGAEVLASILGDQTTFSFPSTTASPAGAERRFTSFRQAAEENADSRVRGGLHFRFSCDAGQELGRQVGVFTLAHHLRPRATTATR